jgi:hypothetical protein
MPYNHIITEIIADDGTITEPVTVAEAKAFAGIVGTAHDTLIGTLITAARQQIEKATKLSITAKTVEVWLSIPEGNFELPYGPVKADPAIVFEDFDGTVVEPTVLLSTYPIIRSSYNELKAEYSTGFEEVPEDLKLAIKQQVSDWFENRGDDPGADVQMRGNLSPIVRNTCIKYSRIPVIY